MPRTREEILVWALENQGIDLGLFLFWGEWYVDQYMLARFGRSLNISDIIKSTKMCRAYDRASWQVKAWHFWVHKHFPDLVKYRTCNRNLRDPKTIVNIAGVDLYRR